MCLNKSCKGAECSSLAVSKSRRWELMWVVGGSGGSGGSGGVASENQNQIKLTLCEKRKP